MTSGAAPVLRVFDLSVLYIGRSGPNQTVRDVSFELRAGRICGLVGESGSGKSTAALAAIGWKTATQRRLGGRSELAGSDLFRMDPKALRAAWGRRIGYVPQEIGGSLHPTYRIRTQFREALRVKLGLTAPEADRRSIDLLAAARIPEPAAALGRFPHEFSGGQLQRIAIALALVLEPEILILDEPTTDLDVTTQQSVTKILRDLVAREGVAALFITHDLALLAEIADDLIVMYAGEVVEAGPVGDVIRAPQHPYTRALLDAVPSADRALTPRGIPGMPPGHVVEGRCGFSDRCEFADERGRTGAPPLTMVGHDRLVRCWRAGELALASTQAPARIVGGTAAAAVLEVRELRCAYGTGRNRLVAVQGASLAVQAGGVAALVGESGSGKSSIGRVIAGIIPAEAGQILVDGAVIPMDPRRRTREQRRAIQIIFQNPSGSLNPRRTVGDLLRHIAGRFLDGPPEIRWDSVRETLAAVQLSDSLMDRYPSQLSGGQRQRVAIASAFIVRPRLVICDEITSGQDVSVQAAILRTLTDLRERFGTAVLFISHDLGVVRSVADHVYVMRQGEIVDQGPSESLFSTPGHAYTKDLLNAVPTISATI
jgi:peptide/nickel transport system ATP-binding protein